MTRTFRRLDPARQRAVVEAIFAEAAEGGPHALQVKAVAHRAGVAVGSLYQYFPGRDGMLDFAVDVTTGVLTSSFDACAPAMADLPLREGLAAYLDAGLEWSTANAGLLTFFARVAYSGEPGYLDRLVTPVATSMRGLLHNLLIGAKTRGELAGDVDVDVTTRLVMALTTAVADAWLLPQLNGYYLLYDDEHPPERVYAATVDFVLRAIGASS